MKTGILILFLFILSCNSNAQNNYSEPLQLNRNFLVNSAGLPEEYLLFVPDSATQILFNPARANNFNTNFIYINYLSDNNPQYFIPIYFRELNKIVIPEGSLQKSGSFNFPSVRQETFTSSKNPSFSAAALINDGGVKWLFELTNGINRTDHLNNIQTIEKNSFTNPNYEAINNIQNLNPLDDGMTTSFKISGIFQTGGLNYSVGLFGIINKHNVNAVSNNNLDDYRFSNYTDSSKFRDNQTENINRTDINNNSRYVIGGEFTINQKYWDYLFTLDYQFGDNSMKKVTFDNTTAYDSSYYPGSTWNYSEFKHVITNDEHTNQTPSFINISNYFRHLINLITPADNIFLTLNLFFSSGEISYTNNYIEWYWNHSGQNTTSDTMSATNTNKFDAKNLGASFTAGYSLSKSFNDLFILSGICFTGNMEQLETIDQLYSNYTTSLVRAKIKPTAASFTLPLYINYNAAVWCSVYGGINYSYNYNRYKIEYSNEETFHASGTNTTLSNNSDYIDQGWQSNKFIYAGCELRHPSGLKIQLFFDEDFTFIRDWNVSIGYHF